MTREKGLEMSEDLKELKVHRRNFVKLERDGKLMGRGHSVALKTFSN